MEDKQKEHFLTVLVESDLYNKLCAISEANIEEEEKSIRLKETIKRFIDGLPKEYKELTNRDQIIKETIRKVKQNKQKIKQSGLTNKQNKRVIERDSITYKEDEQR